MKASPPPLSPPPPPAPVVPASPPEAVSTEPAVSATESKWPAWFGSADLLAFVLVAAAAFLAASFAARNSDVWLHLAAGQRLLEGSYALGFDPFSYTAADRVWVNSSWAFDLLFHLVHRADESGAIAVILKAVAFALAFTLPAILRRPGQALWPWAVVAAVAMLAAVPMNFLRPTAASMLFLSLTIVAVYCCPWPNGSWRKPGGIAVLFLIWTNIDEWFFLGPFALALILIGEIIQAKLPTRTADSDTAFPPPPAVGGLAKALLLGTAACLLNPTLLIALTSSPNEALVQLIPAELGWTLPTQAMSDPQYRLLSLSPIDARFTGSPSLGYNHNGFAAALLLVGGAIVLAAGFARLRAAHLLLWIGFAALAIESYRLIPYFAVIAVPLIAGHLNGLASRVRLGPASAQGTRILLTAASVGRILLVAIAVGLVVAAWPGWLHGQRLILDSSQAYRVDWKIIPDGGLVRAAQQIQQWRTGDPPKLPTEVRGIQSDMDFGNYCTWFAPAEKVFITSQFVLHREELTQLAELRNTLQFARPDQSGSMTTALNPVNELLKQHEASYLVLTQRDRTIDLDNVLIFLNEPQSWSLWHLEGRMAMIGRSDVAPSLRFNPVQLAFGPDVPPVPAHSATFPPPETLDFFDQYVSRPEIPSFWADDALIYMQFFFALDRKTQAERQYRETVGVLARSAIASSAAGHFMVLTESPPPPDELIALSLLAARAARRAIAATPDRSEGYQALAVAYSTRVLPVPDPATSQLQGITARVMFQNRVPGPGQLPISSLQLVATLARELAGIYEQTGQLDLAREAIQRATAYIKTAVAMNPGFFLSRLPKDTKFESIVPNLLNELQITQLDERITKAVQIQNDQYQQYLEQAKPSAADKFQMAIRLGFPGRAMELFTSTDPGVFGEKITAVTLQFIQLELNAGRLPQAVHDLEELQKQLEAESAQGKPASPQLLTEVRNLRILADRLEGDFQAAAELFAEQFALQGSPADDRIRLSTPQAAIAQGGVAGGSATFIQFQGTLPIRQALLAESIYYYTRGIFALHAGATKEAPQWFRQSLEPHGVPVQSLGMPSPVVESQRYLRLLEEAGNADPNPR